MERIITDLEKLVEYMWAEENKHWEEEGNPQDHIFQSINNVKNYLIGRENEQKNKKRTSRRSNRETKKI
tara:strand:+ start:229 stop:435 length:207 start_codon:yes stop_codon:yes gene_type:complete